MPSHVEVGRPAVLHMPSILPGWAVGAGEFCVKTQIVRLPCLEDDMILSYPGDFATAHRWRRRLIRIARERRAGR